MINRMQMYYKSMIKFCDHHPGMSYLGGRYKRILDDLIINPDIDNLISKYKTIEQKLYDRTVNGERRAVENWEIYHAVVEQLEKVKAGEDPLADSTDSIIEVK